ncbi:MAG: hypothetical protein U0Q21_16015 [Dermatophilaceae bacterium]
MTCVRCALALPGEARVCPRCGLAVGEPSRDGEPVASTPIWASDPLAPQARVPSADPFRVTDPDLDATTVRPQDPFALGDPFTPSEPFASAEPFRLGDPLQAARTVRPAGGFPSGFPAGDPFNFGGPVASPTAPSPRATTPVARPSGRSPRSTGRLVGIGLALLGLTGAGVGGAYLIVGRDSAHTSTASARSTSPTTRPDQAHIDAKAAATALAELPDDPASVLATDAKKLVPDPRSAVPAGTTIHADEATWAPDGTGVGGTMTVHITYPGKPAATYLAVLVKETSGWKVLATVGAGS